MAKTSIAVHITGDVRDLKRAFGEAENAAQKMGRRMSSLGSAMTAGVTLPLAAAGAAAVKLFNEQEKAEAKLRSSFESMKAAAWTSEQALMDHASAIQANSTYGDEAVISMQSVLLTFGQIKDVAGEGNDVFSRTTEVVVDMAAALEMDLQSAAIQLGKALNDPVANLSALSRAGIQFTDEQKELIKTLWESGDALGAQKVILEELERQFGGTAAALADTAGGRMQQALNDMGDAMEEVGAIIAPVLSDLAETVSGLAKRFQELDESAQSNLVKGAIAAAAAGPVLWLTGKLTAMAGAVIAVGKAFATAGLGNAILGAASAMGKLAAAAGTAGTVGAAAALAAVAVEANRVKQAMWEADQQSADLASTIGGAGVFGQAVLAAFGIVERFGIGVDEAGQAIDDELRASLNESIPTIDDWRSEAHGAVQVTGDWPEPLYAAAAALGEVEKAAENAVTDIGRTGQAMLDALNPAKQLRQANEEYEESLRNYRDVMGDAESTTQDQEDALWRLLEAMGNVTAAHDTFGVNFDEQAFRTMAAAIGLTADEIDRLLNSIGAANGASMDVQVTTANGRVRTIKVDSTRGATGGMGVYHDGGVVPGPPGSEQLAILKAGETVLPTHKTGGYAGATIHIHNPTTNDLNADISKAMTAVRLLGVV